MQSTLSKSMIPLQHCYFVCLVSETSPHQSPIRIKITRTSCGIPSRFTGPRKSSVACPVQGVYHSSLARIFQYRQTQVGSEQVRTRHQSMFRSNETVANQLYGY